MTESRWNSRKLWLVLLTIAAATVLCAGDRLEGEQWVDAVVWLAGLYCTGNVATAWVQRS